MAGLFISRPGRFTALVRSVLIAFCIGAMWMPSPDALAGNEDSMLSTSPALPGRSAAYDATLAALPKGFRICQTTRYIVFSNEKARWTQAQLVRLEAACDQFHRFARSVGLRPAPLRHKLVCVLFREKEDFSRFALDHDQMNSSWSLGYYSPRSDRIAFYNAEAEEDADEFASKRVIATTIHEAIHQLSFHTRIQTIHVQYPLWINEGLATSFETDSPNEAFGPDHEFDARRHRFRTLLEDGQLIPLRSFVALDQMPDSGRETVFTVYNQSYALFSWLARHRKKQLREYLALMLKEPPGRPSAARHLELFEQAFGDADRLEAAWLTDERQQLACGSASQSAPSGFRQMSVNEPICAAFETPCDRCGSSSLFQIEVGTRADVRIRPLNPAGPQGPMWLIGDSE